LLYFMPAALLLSAHAPPAAATDLSTVNRRIPAEPGYRATTQGYCLLVFGPEARTRVWLVRDGNVMHIHASPDGKTPSQWRSMTGTNAWNWPLGDVWEEGGTVCYRGLAYSPSNDEWRFSVLVGGKRQVAGFDHRGELKLAPTAKDAPIVHFGGSLTLDLFRNQQPIRTGKNVNITAVVGTHGVGPGTFALFDLSSYPANKWPTAVVEVPAKNGGPPIVWTKTLDDD
jgi:hypothetical protein